MQTTMGEVKFSFLIEDRKYKPVLALFSDLPLFLCDLGTIAIWGQDLWVAIIMWF